MVTSETKCSVCWFVSDKNGCGGVDVVPVARNRNQKRPLVTMAAILRFHRRIGVYWLNQRLLYCEG